jgi:hypothetical protein
MKATAAIPLEAKLQYRLGLNFFSREVIDLIICGFLYYLEDSADYINNFYILPPNFFWWRMGDEFEEVLFRIRLNSMVEFFITKR